MSNTWGKFDIGRACVRRLGVCRLAIIRRLPRRAHEGYRAERLRAWSAAAEHSGIEVLEEFSVYLRG
jgi:hypothetical protein